MSVFHLIGLPHTTTTRAFDHCAFTAKTRKWADMMTAHGETVILYAAGDHTEASCAEYVPLLTTERQAQLFDGCAWWPAQPASVDWDPWQAFWQEFNAAAVREVRARVRSDDWVCLLGGRAQSDIVTAFADRTVEVGVGYEGTVAAYRVWESYAWMHAVYGHQQGAAAANGHFFDAVIPNYYDPGEFPGPGESYGYLLFMSRMTPRKGYSIAFDVAEATGRPLVVAGNQGDQPSSPHVEYVGHADTRKRANLLAHAHAVLVPTLYLEPFGGVAAEAMMCGTPVISTDWGAFTETVAQGVDGYRCRTLREFIDATVNVEQLDRQLIRDRAIARFSYDAVAPQYQRYFQRLSAWVLDGVHA